ncbi:MAG: CHY zinc finger protein [Acidobacteriota bacterium]
MIEVKGINVDSQTRCGHYHSEIDIIAIKFKCCGDWFPCFECHSEIANHPSEVWAFDERETKAILCGNCRHQLTINEYFNCNSSCPKCSHQFNPKCANHYDLYFEI